MSKRLRSPALRVLQAEHTHFVLRGLLRHTSEHQHCFEQRKVTARTHHLPLAEGREAIGEVERIAVAGVEVPLRPEATGIRQRAALGAEEVEHEGVTGRDAVAVDIEGALMLQKKPVTAGRILIASKHTASVYSMSRTA